MQRLVNTVRANVRLETVNYFTTNTVMYINEHICELLSSDFLLLLSAFAEELLACHLSQFRKFVVDGLSQQIKIQALSQYSNSCVNSSKYNLCHLCLGEN